MYCMCYISNFRSLFTTIVGFVFLNDFMCTTETGTLSSQVQNGRDQWHVSFKLPTVQPPSCVFRTAPLHVSFMHAQFAWNAEWSACRPKNVGAGTMFLKYFTKSLMMRCHAYLYWEVHQKSLITYRGY